MTRAAARQPTEVRKEQIARAAVDIIGREGIKSFTTANVAREVGISEASLYRHFRNKDAILLAVVDSIEDTLGGNVREVVGSDLSGIEKLERVFRLHAGFIDENSGIPRIVFSAEALFVKGLRKKLLGFVTSYLNMLAGLLREGQADGSVRKDISPEANAAALIGIIQFNALRGMLSGDGPGLSERADEVWEAYARGLRP